MKYQSVRRVKLLGAVMLIAGSLNSIQAMQFQNPIQAAQDAYNKAKQQQQKPGQPAPAPGQQQTP